MGAGAFIESVRGSSPDSGVTVHFDQEWFDRLALEALLVDGNIVRYRARSQDAAQSWLIAVPTDLPSEAVLRRLQQEFAPADQLDSTWAVRPVALVRLLRGPVLVYEDNGGTLVLPPANGMIAVGRFLRIAVGAAHALRRARARRPASRPQAVQSAGMQ